MLQLGMPSPVGSAIRIEFAYFGYAGSDLLGGPQLTIAIEGPPEDSRWAGSCKFSIIQAYYCANHGP